MDRPALILYLEDNPRDAELVRAKLQLAALACELQVVSCHAEYQAALAERHFDLILSDFSLPGYDGMSALALARNMQPDVPFILISGTLGEEQAVDCMLRGATDFVLKQRLSRLDPAVRRALDEAEALQKRREAEEDRNKALRRAEASAAAKSEFLSVMSHELRTPLNGVLGFAELLTYTQLDDVQKSYVATIAKSGKHLLEIVNDILDFSSIEAGSLAIQVAPMGVSELVELAGLAIRKSAADKGIGFRSEVVAGVPDQIVGDERRIFQILLNLVGNAVKFTLSGSVVLRVALSPADGPPSLDFSVEDTGPGISSETLARLFVPFTQADSTTSRRFGGTGLGLAISKRLAEAMNGSILVASTPGQGSTFTFRLPLEDRSRAPAPCDPAPPAPGAPGIFSSAGGLVLVAEDDLTCRSVAGQMLASLGCRAKFATHGADAVEAFAPEKFFAILMDVGMPLMDGIEATRRIREIEAQSGSHVPIIALTANVMPGDRERCLAAGMDDFLAKPFKRDELAAKLARAAEMQGSNGRMQRPDCS
ncbi:MAG: response regulator [Verrucomicrobiae bacterium]